MIDHILHSAWYIDDSIPARVYTFKGFKLWVDNIANNYPHADVTTYCLKFPNGITVKGDASILNKVLYNYFTTNN